MLPLYREFQLKTFPSNTPYQTHLITIDELTSYSLNTTYHFKIIYLIPCDAFSISIDITNDHSADQVGLRLMYYFPIDSQKSIPRL